MFSQQLDIKAIINEAAMTSKTNEVVTTNTTEPDNTVIEGSSAVDNTVEVLKETVEAAEEVEIFNVELQAAQKTEVIPEKKMPKVYEEVQGEAFAWEVITEQQIVIDNIRDEQGYLSQKIQDLLDKYEIGAIPLQVTDILPQVTELKEHDLINVDGVVYATYRGCDRDKLVRYRDEIIASLKTGLPYKKSLMIDVPINEDESFKTLDMTKTEWDFLCSLFRNYNPRLVMTEDNDFILLVG